MAYNSSNGVCFEAIKDIKAGEELMALFDSLKGTVIVESYWAKVGERESKKMKEGRVGSSSPRPPPPPPPPLPQEQLHCNRILYKNIFRFINN